jgi:large subunit ribosomal protein L39e
MLFLHPSREPTVQSGGSGCQLQLSNAAGNVPDLIPGISFASAQSVPWGFQKVHVVLQKSGGFGRPSQMASHKTFRTKRTLAKKIKQNRPMPQFLRKMTGIRHVGNPERRHWRRRKLNI